MLLRLTLRMSDENLGSGSIPTLDIVRKCAMFRGIERKGKKKPCDNDAGSWHTISLMAQAIRVLQQKQPSV